MRETFILANGLSGNELSRSLSKIGINTCALRVKCAADLALEALLRSGIVIDKKIVTNIEQCAIVYSFLNEIEYFKNASYTDACNLVKAFHTMRSCIVVGDELDEIRARMKKGTFKTKNEAVVEAFVRYSNYTYQNDLIDSDGIIREAINNAKSIDADFIRLKEYELTPLENKLLEVISAGNIKEQSVYDIYNKEKLDIKFDEVSKAYGAINEVENIFEDIYSNHKLDECVIACTNIKSYSQLIYNLSLQYNIPVTFASGISINNSNPAKLLKVLVEWDNLGFNGVDALYKLLTCEALDWRFFAPAIGFSGDISDDIIRKFAEYVGNLKLSTDKNSNVAKLSKITDRDEMFAYATKFAEAMQDGIIEFLKKFVLLRDENPIDETALSGIIKEIEIFKKYNPGKLMSEVIPQITNELIGGELSCQGSVHVTSLNGLFSLPRKNVYICGLSSKEFPGAANENYLLLDSDLKNFECAKLSDDKVLDKVKLFDNVLSFISSAGCKTRLSYSYFDLAELKEQNASSVLYRLVDDVDKLKTINYFDSHFSSSREICEAYKNGVEVNYDIEAKKAESQTDLLDRGWSFSAIDTYFTCPRKFFLRYILKVPEIERNDPFEVIDAKEIGSLAHEMMEELGRTNISKQDFMAKCSIALDRVLIKKPALIESKMENAKQEFLDMMSMAYDFDSDNTRDVSLSEQYLEAMHDESGVKLHGFPDRIESDGNSVSVIDFKTGRDVKHIQNNPKSCLQALIYAYVYEKNNPGIKVSSAEFRYLRNSAVISCAFDDKAKEKLTEILKDFAKGLKENNFERKAKDCKYCSFSDLCLWPGEIDEEKEDGNE